VSILEALLSWFLFWCIKIDCECSSLLQDNKVDPLKGKATTWKEDILG
jgi:hypothetical protein